MGLYLIEIFHTDREVTEKLSRVILNVNANQAGRYRDGKLFVSPLTDAVRIRTGERGNKALS